MAFYPYNNGVPNAPDNPSQDQPDMLVNTQSISGIIAQDHTGFGVSNGGVHKQVRFAQNIAAPGIASGWVSALFSDTLNGQAWPFWQNAGGSELIVGPSLNQLNNGYILIGAYMFQWGEIVTATVGGQAGIGAVAFNPAFSAVPFVIKTQIEGINTNIPRFAFWSNPLITGVTIYVTNGQGGGGQNGVTVNWLAIGLR